MIKLQYKRMHMARLAILAVLVCCAGVTPSYAHVVKAPEIAMPGVAAEASSLVSHDSARVDSQAQGERKSFVTKYVLDNGLTVLVRPVKTMQKVAVQLWYGVGAKHEQEKEKGIAHLIEHMLFKGTEKLSETDIDLITQKFSGHFNAFTSYDTTCMVVDLPVAHWRVALPIMADCMGNCTFKQELLNSELKVVVQELKLYRDSFLRTLCGELISAIYPDHPYHYPIIGYKQDLWNADVSMLKSFYKKHYVPNNAVLVVVGNVDPQEVVALAHEQFGALPVDPGYKQPELYINKDLKAQAVTIYRDVQRPQVLLAFSVPGAREMAERKLDYSFSLLDKILANGKTSRLHKKLIDELQLVDHLQGIDYGFMDAGLYFIYIEPRELEQVDKIIKIVHAELKNIAQKGCTSQELECASKLYQSSFYQMLESNSSQASSIGWAYNVTGDENYIYTVADENLERVNATIKEFAAAYLRPTVMHKGFVLPLPEEEKEQWQLLQERSDEEDARILAGRVRESAPEPGKYVHTLSVDQAQGKEYPKPQILTLSNGVRVLYYQASHVPLVEFMLKLKADSDYEPADMPGLFSCLEYMLREGGTRNRSALDLAQEFDKLGVQFGSVGIEGCSATITSKNLPEALALIYEAVTQPAFDKDALPKVKAWMQADYKEFWDDEHSVLEMLQDQKIFKDHPQGRNHVADPEAIKKITLDRIRETYERFISPDGATIILVGDLEKYPHLKDMLEATFGSWKGPKIPELEYPEVKHERPHEVKYHMNRDQVLVRLAGLSVNRYHPDFDALSLYDVLLHSRLFRLREKSGAFYTIKGSVRNGSGKQPGVASISTVVSKDRLKEVIALIRDFIEHDIDSLTEQDLKAARNDILKSLDDRYSTNTTMADMFSFLNYYNFGFDYFDKRGQRLAQISIDDVKRAVKNVFNLRTMHLFLVGRVGSRDECMELELPVAQPPAKQTAPSATQEA
jgi:zinc protease